VTRLPATRYLAVPVHLLAREVSVSTRMMVLAVQALVLVSTACQPMTDSGKHLAILRK